MTTGHHLRIVNVGDILSPAAHRNSAGEAVINITKGHRITFGDLNERVNRLSHALIATVALTPGDRVAILSKNAAEYFEILFACAKTGLIAQPLNWRLAGPELRRIVLEASPRAVVYNREFAAQAGALRSGLPDTEWIEFSSGMESGYERLLADQPADEPVRGAADDDPFFILCTGGTTGVPKGALHTHRSTTVAMYNQTVGEQLRSDDVYMLTGQSNDLRLNPAEVLDLAAER